MINISSNIDEVIARFKEKGDRMKGIDVSEALLVGVNAARGEMTFRIFNKGLDAEGSSLGVYVGKKRFMLVRRLPSNIDLIGNANRFTEYEIKRLTKGRQIVYKDLEFEGALRRGIVTLRESGTKVVCSIPNSKLYTIARGQEEQIGRILGKGRALIFQLSKEERETLRENTIEAIKQLYVRLFNS